MLIKFVETSTDQVNEAFDLNEKLLQLQQTLNMSDLVKELDSEFPFYLEDREELSDSDMPDMDDLLKDDLNMKSTVAKLTALAQRHILHLNFLSQTSNQ